MTINKEAMLISLHFDRLVNTNKSLGGQFKNLLADTKNSFLLTFHVIKLDGL